jgi:hypothetical protein
MNDVVRVAKRLIPVEQIVLVEPFTSTPNMSMRTARDFKARIVLLDKASVLTEETPDQLATAYSFRMIALDCVATNPAVEFRVETFEASDTFKSERPFQARLSWSDQNGNTHSKLLISSPETVLAIAVRGESNPEFLDAGSPGDAPLRPRARRPARRKAAFVRKDPH